METYTTEEEQVEAIRRWWDENGRSIIAGVVIALVGGFGWQGWKDYSQGMTEDASDLYLAMQEQIGGQGDEQLGAAADLAQQLKTDYSGSSYAQFGALHLAKMAVDRADLTEAEAQLRWVLGKADKGSDVALLAELRLARVLAANGDTEQALAILSQNTEASYVASYAIAQGDTLMQMARPEEARDAYAKAQLFIAQSGQQINIVTLTQKIQSLNPVPARDLVEAAEAQATVVEAQPLVAPAAVPEVSAQPEEE